MTSPQPHTTTLIGLGGGCHWCTEAVFQHLLGVEEVEQGFIASNAPHDTYSEAILAHFDASRIPLRILLAAHLHTHSSTSQHALRSRYRSAIYTTSEAQAQLVQRELDTLQHDWERPLITQVLPLVDFRLNDPRYHNYYRTRPDSQFCQVHIEPKLATLRELFMPYFHQEEREHHG